MSVTPPRPGDNAAIALARLKASSPQTFAEVLTQFRAMKDAACTACVHATLDKVQIMQGKAQQLAELVTLLEGCTEEARALEAKLKEKK
jgi:hypothetical protein